MLDTGSEANIIKIGVIQNYLQYLDNSKRNVLKGIALDPFPTLGTITLHIFKNAVDFMVVPNYFRISCDALLGSTFFSKAGAIINFENNYLLVGEQTLPLQVADDFVFAGFCQVNNVNEETSPFILPRIQVKNSPSGNKKQFLIDSGSEVNLIKKSLLPPGIEIDDTELIHLKGIGKETQKTLGTTEIKLLDTHAIFHVVSDEFEMDHNGVLGIAFLKDSLAQIDFNSNTFKTRNHSMPLNIENHTSEKAARCNGVKLDTKLEQEKFDKILQNLIPMNEEKQSEDELGLAVKYVYSINDVQTFEELNVLNPEETEEMNEVNLTDLIMEEPKIEKKVEDYLDFSHMTQSEKEHMTKIIYEIEDAFYLPGDELPGTDMVTHEINTIDDIPINCRQCQFPHAMVDKLDYHIKKLLKSGIIKESNSPYNNPIWIVPKATDEKGRMVCDMRALTEKTLPDSYPIPNICNIFDQVGGYKYYSVLDLAMGFYQVKTHPKHAHKTAFSTPFGHYEFVRMPFGLRNAPATFQRLMDNLLRGLQGFEVFVYLDDIIIYANTIGEHDRKLRLLVERLRKRQV